MGVRPLHFPGPVGAFHGSQLEGNPVSPLLTSRLILHRTEPIHVEDHSMLGHEPDVLCQVLEGVQFDGITLSAGLVNHLASGTTRFVVQIDLHFDVRRSIRTIFWILNNLLLLVWIL